MSNTIYRGAPQPDQKSIYDETFWNEDSDASLIPNLKQFADYMGYTIKVTQDQCPDLDGEEKLDCFVVDIECNDENDHTHQFVLVPFGTTVQIRMFDKTSWTPEVEPSVGAVWCIVTGV